MLARHWLVAGLLAIATTAAAETDVKPKPYDIKAIKDQLSIYQDGHGATYAVYVVDNDAIVFYGTAKTLYLQTDTLVASRDGAAWSVRAAAPRLPDPHYGYIDRLGDGTFKKTCNGKDDAVLTQLTGDKAKAVIDKYSFVTTGIIHLSSLLARDDSGIYYYVDHLAESYGGKGFRVFTGRKGAMKQLPLTDVAVDTGGMVFSTKTGDLRLVKNTNGPEKASHTESVMWIKGEKRMPLVTLDPYMNSELIYGELGIYTFLGTLCDNVL